MRVPAGILLLAFPISLACAGCAGAGTPPCVTADELEPGNLVLDHAASAPENQTTYAIGTKIVQGQCPLPAHLLGVTSLTVSDTANVQVTSESGLAVVTCVGATNGPVTVAAGTLTAKLTCK